jgi:hypothetical protein
MILPVHPFPARMAPELALSSLESLQPGSLAPDPFAGSGTVLRKATEIGHRAVGFDAVGTDTRVWTTPVSDDVIGDLADWVLRTARRFQVRETGARQYWK